MKSCSSFALLVVLGTFVLLPRATPLDACPDQVAVTRPAVTQDFEPTSTCSVEVTIFDLPITLAGVPCPASRLTIPPHETCRDVAGSTTMCVGDGSASVTIEHCHCGGLAGVSAQFEFCFCSPPLAIGTVPRMRTVDC